MTATTEARTFTPAAVLRAAADLIERYGLCRTDYEGRDGSLDPSGAVAVVLGVEPAVWSRPTESFVESGAYDVGFGALYALVESLGRWDMDRSGEELWDGESLANHIAWWMDDLRPSVEQVIHQMVAAALGLTGQAVTQ